MLIHIYKKAELIDLTYGNEIFMKWKYKPCMYEISDYISLKQL